MWSSSTNAAVTKLISFLLFFPILIFFSFTFLSKLRRHFYWRLNNSTLNGVFASLVLFFLILFYSTRKNSNDHSFTKYKKAKDNDQRNSEKNIWLSIRSITSLATRCFVLMKSCFFESLFLQLITFHFILSFLMRVRLPSA